MDEKIKKILESSGINTGEFLSRVMGNEGLMFKLLRLFPKDENYRALKSAVESGDREKALAAAHTLKGMSGNISAARLFDLFSQQVALMREDKWDLAFEMMPEISNEYDYLVGAIQENL